MVLAEQLSLMSDAVERAGRQVALAAPPSWRGEASVRFEQRREELVGALAQLQHLVLAAVPITAEYERQWWLKASGGSAQQAAPGLPSGPGVAW